MGDFSIPTIESPKVINTHFGQTFRCKGGVAGKDGGYQFMRIAKEEDYLSPSGCFYLKHVQYYCSHVSPSFSFWIRIEWGILRIGCLIDSRYQQYHQYIAIAFKGAITHIIYYYFKINVDKFIQMRLLGLVHNLNDKKMLVWLHFEWKETLNVIIYIWSCLIASLLLSNCSF